MEIFFVAAKTKAQRALSGAFQLCVPAPNQRLLLAAGSFASPEEPWQRRTRAKQVERLLQDAAPSVKGVAELWSQLAKKLPEIAQNSLVLGLLLEDGSFEARFVGAGSLLLKSESKQRLVALQNESLSLSAEVMAGSKELLFFEDPVERAEEIAALLQDAEQVLGEAAVRRLLVASPSEPVAAPAPAQKEANNTPREVAVPLSPAQGWRLYAPWGVAATMTLLLLTSLLWRPSMTGATSTKAAVVDTRPKFIPQPEEPIAESKTPAKTTAEAPTSKPTRPLVGIEPDGPASLPASAPAKPSTKPSKPKTPVKTTKTPTKKTPSR